MLAQHALLRPRVLRGGDGVHQLLICGQLARRLLDSLRIDKGVRCGGGFQIHFPHQQLLDARARRLRLGGVGRLRALRLLGQFAVDLSQVLRAMPPTPAHVRRAIALRLCIPLAVGPVLNAARCVDPVERAPKRRIVRVGADAEQIKRPVDTLRLASVQLRERRCADGAQSGVQLAIAEPFVPQGFGELLSLAPQHAAVVRPSLQQLPDAFADLLAERGSKLRFVRPRLLRRRVVVQRLDGFL